VGKASRLKRERRKLLELISQAQSSRLTQANRTGIWDHIPPIARALIGGAVPLFTLWIGYVQTIKPRILIEPPLTSVDPSSPYVTPFTLINNGYFAVYNVSVDCGLASIAATGLVPSTPRTPWKVNAFVRRDVLNQDALPAMEPRPFVCNGFKQIRPTNLKIDGVELEVRVSVSPLSFINWTHSKSVLFEADGDGTAKFQWRELGIGEEPHFPKSSALFGFSNGQIVGRIRR